MGLWSRKGWGERRLEAGVGGVTLIAHDYAWKEYEDASSDGAEGWVTKPWSHRLIDVVHRFCWSDLFSTLWPFWALAHHVLLTN